MIVSVCQSLRRLGILGAVCAAALSLNARELTEYTLRLWQTEDGLPHNFVRALAQTRDGYLWVATREGLARFDGVRFQLLDFPELASVNISALCESRDGQLWIGADTGLFRWSKGQLWRYTSANGLPDDAVQAIQEDQDGSLWIACRTGVAQIRQGQIRQPFAAAWQEGQEDMEEIVRAMCIDHEGALWIAGTSLKRWHGQTIETFTHEDGIIEEPLRSPSSAKDGSVWFRSSNFGGMFGLRSLYSAKDGSVWIGTDAGLSRWKEGRFANYPKGRDPSAFINFTFEDREGQFWVGTYGGLGRFVEGEFLDEFGEDATFAGIQSAKSMTEDREGNLWIASNEGLIRLTPKRFVTFNQRRGLFNNRTRAVCAGQDGSIWIGVWSGGLNRWKDGELSAHALDSDFSLQIFSLHEGRDGSLWVGMTSGDGLNRIKDGRVTHYGATEGLVTRAITAIHEDRQGNVWIGSTTGLNRFQHQTFTRYTTGEGLNHNHINVLCEAQDETLWIGTESGVTQWKGRLDVAAICSGLPVISMYEDNDQTLWIGTRGAGLWRVGGFPHERSPLPLRGGEGAGPAPGTPHITVYSMANGLSGDSIYSILEDDRNYLWMQSGNGIFRVSKQELNEVARGVLSSVTSTTYGRADGILSSGQFPVASQSAACKGTDGRLWFRTTQGVIVVDPAKVPTNELPPPVVVDRVLADKKQVSDWLGQSFPLNLPPGIGELEIHYSALSFTAPEKNQFKYKLEGHDRDWVEAGTRRAAYYNNLSPGSYTFRVQGSNHDGVWNESGAALAISLAPYFWQRWWFLAAGVMAAVGTVAGTVRYRTQKKMDRRLALMEHQHAVERERSRIARDMHDDLGVRLTELLLTADCAMREETGLAEAKSLVRRSSKSLREAVDSLDAIVWAVNPKNDSLERFVAYINEYLGGFIGMTATRWRVEVPVSVPPWPLSSEVRHNVFLVIREALNNVVKHAEASEVLFQLTLTASGLRMAIEDNGAGFAPADMSSLGNGLQNMKDRMQQLGGSFELDSQPGKGTRIRLYLPIVNAERRCRGEKTHREFSPLIQNDR